jgi:hypothetical protein
MNRFNSGMIQLRDGKYLQLDGSRLTFQMMIAYTMVAIGFHVISPLAGWLI